MSELYSNEPNKLRYTVTNQGQEAAPNSFVASIRVGNSRNDMGDYVALTSDEENVGEYEYIVPNTLLNGYRYAEVKIVYDLEGHGLITDKIVFDIAKRYIGYADIKKILGEDFDLEYWLYDLTEKDVRLAIDSYCLQSFNSWEGERRVRATSGYLQLPQHLDSLDTVRIYTSPYDLTYQQPVPIKDQFHPTDAGNAVINVDLFDSIYYKDRRVKTEYYSVSGVWGYTSVPVAVQQAAIAMFRANLCDDKEYRNRYIDNLRNENMRIQLRDEAFSGDTTGNAFADDILAPYKILPIGIA